MSAEITFDLVMSDDMGFAEGCYRLSDGIWRIFLVYHAIGNEEVKIVKDAAWESGVRGFYAILDRSIKINKGTVTKLLSDELGVSEWTEVNGPDSMALRGRNLN